MIGSMQEWPLLVWKLLDHAALNHGDREIVTQTVEGPLHRSNWREVHARAKRLAKALSRLGVKQGDRVATMAWNTHRHVECWYAISGMGAVAHTLNPRLFQDQIVYIVSHAEDRVLFFDLDLLRLVEAIAPRLETVEHFVVMTDRAHMPGSTLDLLCYEELIAAESADFQWAEIDETAPAGLCYTSGTTGDPKGVLYSHRSNVLHTLGVLGVDALAMSSRSVVLPVVPMYHANAWGIPYAAAAVGAKIVMGGPHFDPETLHRLTVDEGVTLSAGVPTVWFGMLNYMEKHGLDLGKMERAVIGGSAAPRSMIETLESRYGVTVVHAWGMTEMSPVGTIGAICAATAQEPRERQLDIKSKQGRPLFGVELTIRDDAGGDLPRDGKTVGYLSARGAWVVKHYFKGDGGTVLDQDCWFDTGDIATIDTRGYVQITDRAKDVIKSGGEWISSIMLENIAVGHPAVAEAAVIGIPHPKWDERPLLILIRKTGAGLSRDEMLAYLSDKVAKWWLPDDVVFVDSLPHTATGKLQKTALREQFRHHGRSS